MLEYSQSSEASLQQSDLLHTFRTKKKPVIPKIDLTNYRTKAILGQRIFDSLESMELNNKIDPHGIYTLAHFFYNYIQ